MKRTYPKSAITILTILLGLVLISIYLFRSLYIQQQELISVQEKRYKTYILATQLRRSSDDLTRLARTYVATGNPKFEKQYWHVLSIRNGTSPLPAHYDRVYWDYLATDKNKEPPYPPGKAVSLKKLIQGAGFTGAERKLLEESEDYSNRLVKTEEIAMHAMKGEFQDKKGKFTITGKPDQKMALDLLHNNKYHEAKIKIMKPIDLFYESLEQRTRKEVDIAAKELNIILDVTIVVFLLTVIVILSLIINEKRYHKNIVEKLNEVVDERTDELNQSNKELQKALDEVNTLRGIIPICSYCHNIRNDEGSWDRMEAYISTHTDAKFSHGICPDCMKKHHDDL